MNKLFLAAAIIVGSLLSSALLTTRADAAGNSAAFSVSEKDLVHYYAPSPNPAVPCASFTSSGLPKNASFDTAAGLFTWLPDFGSAGSYTVSFGCADDPAAPGTQQIQFDVAPVTPVNLQSGSPKVTLVAAKTPANASQDNDQKSLASMLGVYGLAVAPVEDLAAAFAAGSVGGILVVPSYMAQSLTPAAVQQVVAYVNAGGSILLFGRSPLSEALGISYSGTPLVVTQFIDYLNPQHPLTWSAGETVEPFAAQASDSILTADQQTRQPLVIGRSCGKGRLLYVGTGDSYTEVSVDSSDAVMALDLATGQRKWINQVKKDDNWLVGCPEQTAGNCPKNSGPDYDFGASAILDTLPDGKQIILAGSKGSIAYGFDPAAGGKMLWQRKLAGGSSTGGIEWGPATDGATMYIAIGDANAKPPNEEGGVFALNAATGEVIWHTPAPAPVCSWGTVNCAKAQPSGVTAIPGLIFAGSWDGHIRGYGAKDGAILWDFDTAQSWDGVNGTKVKGGAMDMGGQVIAGGMLLVNSGVTPIQHPGNALLAFTVDGK